MKTFLIAFALILIGCSLKAQQNWEVKVSTYSYKPVWGRLKKVNTEGIGIEDKKGNYYIFRPTEIRSVKIKEKGLGFGEAVGGGTLLGLGIGISVWSLDKEGNNTGSMAKLTAALTATGAVAGGLVGGVAVLIRKGFTLKVKGNPDYFNANYNRLEPYVDRTEIKYVSY
ncbi:hypothetical protein [Pedobacter montanisoli]|uniref:Glycine zipper family protein n=1 Tax=Pedobacter montanisoli TaxID=2923277 RepID=A0ABS9ZXH7_9SPHI|nr:hypothetical protein [Pedobacter montanisoli]MCJ0742999.1 hypothetical protein [Pedobacter montanisoli]